MPKRRKAFKPYETQLNPTNLPTRGFTWERHPDLPQITNTRINGWGFCFDRGTLRHADSIIGSSIASGERIRAFERAVGPEYLAELDAFIDANKGGPLDIALDAMCDELVKS